MASMVAGGHAHQADGERGPIACATAPPTRMPSPWTAYRPGRATRNAQALVAGRRACTKAAAAGSWWAPGVGQHPSGRTAEILGYRHHCV